ncbi:MAG: Nif3-like dinuclear metal center hexameric protein [Candidatus Ornithospirochaeta sp.]
MTVHEYADYLSSLMDIGSFSDVSQNGIQIDSQDKELGKVAFAVDATLSSVSRAAEAGADILVVHHGLFWNKSLTITGDHYRRVKCAMTNNLMVYGCHLPLDAHGTYGNNARIADALDLCGREEFAYWNGKAIGVKGKFLCPLTIDEVMEKLGVGRTQVDLVLPPGKEKFSTVAVCSGSGSSEIGEAISSGVDLLVTGEIKHEVYWSAFEAGLSVLAFGHYRSEEYGVKALMEMTEDMGIECIFLEGDTGL